MNIYDEFIFSMYPHNFQDKHWSKFLFFFNPSSSTCLFNRWMYWFYWSSPFNATYKKGATAIHVFFPPRNICKLSVSVSKIKAMGITSTFVFNFTEMLNVIWLLWTLTTSSFLKRRNMALKCCYLNFSPVPCFFSFNCMIDTQESKEQKSVRGRRRRRGSFVVSNSDLYLFQF